MSYLDCNFLIQIRTNPDFLAIRLCSISAAELTALTSFHQGLEPPMQRSQLSLYNSLIGFIRLILSRNKAGTRDPTAKAK